jgi:hypothetical protein
VREDRERREREKAGEKAEREGREKAGEKAEREGREKGERREREGREREKGRVDKPLNSGEGEVVSWYLARSARRLLKSEARESPVTSLRVESVRSVSMVLCFLVLVAGGGRVEPSERSTDKILVIIYWIKSDSGAQIMAEIKTTINTRVRSPSRSRKEQDPSEEDDVWFDCTEVSDWDWDGFHSQRLSLTLRVDFKERQQVTPSHASHEPSSGSARLYVTDCMKSMMMILEKSDKTLITRGNSGE